MSDGAEIGICCSPHMIQILKQFFEGYEYHGLGLLRRQPLNQSLGLLFLNIFFNFFPKI